MGRTVGAFPTQITAFPQLVVEKIDSDHSYKVPRPRDMALQRTVHRPVG